MTCSMLCGVLPVLQAPFHQDETLDLDALQGEVSWVAAQGVDGVVVGMVTEILRLSDAEWGDLIRTTCEAAAACELPTIVSVGAESTTLALRRASAAAEAGAAALMAIPPCTVTLPEDAVTGYYESLLNATDLPLIVQDASSYVGRPLSVTLQARLLASYPDRVLFKPETEPLGPRVTALRTATAGEAKVFEGTGGIALIDTYRRGIVGTMPGADLCWALVAMWRSLARGDFESAYEIAAPLIGIIGLQPTLDSFVVIEKYLLCKQGVLPNAIARRPLSFHLDPETRNETDRLYERLQQVTQAVLSKADREASPPPLTDTAMPPTGTVSLT